MNARAVLSPVTRVQSTFYAMWGGVDGEGFLCYGRPEKAVSCLPARPRVARGNLRGLESRAVLREPFAVGGRPKLLPCLRAKVFGPERKASQGSLRARPQRVPSRLVGNLLHGYLPVAVDPVQGLLVVPVRANRLCRPATATVHCSTLAKLQMA